MRTASDKTVSFKVTGLAAPGFRRAGIFFPIGKEIVVERASLTAEQAHDLLNTPALRVEEVAAATPAPPLPPPPPPPAPAASKDRGGK